MLVHSADGYLAATVDARADRHTAGLLRWLVLGAAGLVALVLALSHTASVGAAAPATYDTTICINYFTCYNSSTGAVVSNTNSGYPTYVGPSYPTYTAPNYSSGYPANTVISTYFDPRYGEVSVVTDQYGNLIDVNALTGQRIYPVFADYGTGFIGANYFNGGYVYNGVNPNYYYGCQAGNFSCLGVNIGCPVGNFSCLGSYPFYPYSTGIYSGTATVVAPSGNAIVVGPPYRVKEVTASTTTAAAVAPAPAPAAPAANYATALNAPSAPATAPAASIGGADVHVLSASPATAPAASGVGGSDDHR
jgi:hypothetical protein